MYLTTIVWRHNYPNLHQHLYNRPLPTITPSNSDPFSFTNLRSVTNFSLFRLWITVYYKMNKCSDRRMEVLLPDHDDRPTTNQPTNRPTDGKTQTSGHTKDQGTTCSFLVKQQMRQMPTLVPPIIRRGVDRLLPGSLKLINLSKFCLSLFWRA